jgi:hypothetical protein
MGHGETEHTANHFNHDMVMTATTLKELRTQHRGQQPLINQNPLQSSLAHCSKKGRTIYQAF